MPGKNANTVYDLSCGASGLVYRVGWLRPLKVVEVWQTDGPPDAAHPPAAWLALAQEQVLTRTFNLPAHDEETIAGLLKHSVRAELPFPESVELRFAWSVIATTETQSTVLLAAAKQEAFDKLVEGQYCQPSCHVVPAFAPLFNLFLTRFPAKRERVYALIHLTPRTSFMMLCRNRELLGVQNLAGLAVRGDPTRTTKATTEEEVAGLCGRLAPLLQRTMHSLETEQKMPHIDEVAVSGACPLPAVLLNDLAAQLGVPVASWPDCGVPAGHLIALGLAGMAAKPQRDGIHLFEFVRDTKPAAKLVLTPLTALRYACHCIIIVMLFLSLQMVIQERIKSASSASRTLAQELIGLQPAVAAGTTLYRSNEELLGQLATDRRSSLPDYATVLARLGEVTPSDVALQKVTIGRETTPNQTASANTVRHIGMAGAGITDTNVRPTVSITGTASDAMAFARYCQRLEQARILCDVKCRHAERAEDGTFAFALVGTL